MNHYMVVLLCHKQNSEAEIKDKKKRKKAVVGEN